MHMNQTRLSELPLVMFAIRRSGRFRRRMSSTYWAFRSLGGAGGCRCLRPGHRPKLALSSALL